VQALAGCLTGMPEQLRLVLEMRAGIGLDRPLGLGAVARALHVSVKDARRLQRRALRLLIRTARTRGCPATAASAATVASAGGAFGVTWPDAGQLLGGIPLQAVGGVLAAHYSQSAAAGPEATQGPGSAEQLGVGSTDGGAGTLLVIAIILAGAVLIGGLFAEEL